jgi:hypothetical protein
VDRVTTAHRTTVKRAVAFGDIRPWLASCSCGWESRHHKREWARTYAARHRDEQKGTDR